MQKPWKQNAKTFWAGKKSGRQKSHNVKCQPLPFSIFTLLIGEHEFQGKRKEKKRLKVGRDVQSKINHFSLMKPIENLETVLQKESNEAKLLLSDSLCLACLSLPHLPVVFNLSDHISTASLSLIYLYFFFLMKKTDNILWVSKV